MATVLKLGNRPKFFAPITVRFTGPDGVDLIIPDVVFAYRTRTEYGEWVDSVNEASAATYTPAPGEKFSVKRLFQATGSGGAKQLAGAISSWGLDLPLSAENLAQLYDESPAAMEALTEAYRAAAVQGRLGN